jgi:peptidyl-prolyl cis-trans isomerase SurA
MKLFNRQTWAKAFLFLNLIGAVLFFSQTVTRTNAAEVIDRIIAIVNDDIVTLAELNRAFAPYVDRIKRLGYSLERQRKVLFEARDQVIDQLVDQKLTDQEVKRLKLKVGEDAVDNAIERIKERQFVTDEQLRNAIQQQGSTMVAYREGIKEQLLREQLVSIEVRSKLVITESEVLAAYEKKAESFAGEKKYRLRHILKRVSRWANAEDKKRIRDELGAVVEKIKAGASFAEMAKAHSESPNAQAGGELGVIDFSSLSAVLKKALADIGPGQHSGIIDTDRGLQIFFVEEIIKTPGKSLEDVRGQLQDQIYRKRIEAQFKSWIETLRKRSHIKIIK